jgi:hypothetical protein
MIYCRRNINLQINYDKNEDIDEEVYHDADARVREIQIGERYRLTVVLMAMVVVMLTVKMVMVMSVVTVV